MKFNLCLAILSSVVFASLTGSQALALEDMHYFEPHTLELNAHLDYFNSNENFGSDGSSSSLSFGNSYSLYQIPFGARLVVGKSLAFRLGGETSYASSKNSDPIYKGDRTNSTFDELNAGAEWKFVDLGAINMIADLDARFGLVPVDNTKDDVLTNEGVTVVTPSVIAQGNLDNITFLGKIGYSARSGGRSSLLPWVVQGAFVFTENVSAGAEIAGSQSISNDTDKGNTIAENARIAVMNRADAQSFRFYSVNPNHVDGTAFLRYNGEKWRFAGYGGATVSGSNYSKGTFFGIEITVITDFGFGNKYQQSQPSQPVENFRTDTNDGVNQQVFENQKVTPKPAPAPRPAAKPRGKAVKQPAPANPNPTTEKDVQQQLDDAEMSIKLKKKGNQ